MIFLCSIVLRISMKLIYFPQIFEEPNIALVMVHDDIFYCQPRLQDIQLVPGRRPSLRMCGH